MMPSGAIEISQYLVIWCLYGTKPYPELRLTYHQLSQIHSNHSRYQSLIQVIKITYFKLQPHISGANEWYKLYLDKKPRCNSVYLHNSGNKISGYMYHQTVFPVNILMASWWHHQMEIFSALLAICAGNSLVIGEFPTLTRSFDVFFDLGLN